MSSKKSTIDRFTHGPTGALPHPTDPSGAGSAETPPGPGVTPSGPHPTAPTSLARADRVGPAERAGRAGRVSPAERVGPAERSALPTPRALPRLFAVLEQTSPALAGRLAEALWFRLPPVPGAARRRQRTPAGGEAFEVEWAGGTVRGRVYGHWGNPTAYLVHGWGGWWQQLAAHVEPLVAAGLCVVALDLPGHGDAGPGRHGRRSTDVVEMAEALAAVVADFGRPTLVVAHSLGAMAAVHALRLGVRPQAYAFLAPPHSAEPMVATFTQALGVGPRSTAVLRRRIETRAGMALADLDVVSTASEQPSLPALLVVHDRGDRETSPAGSVQITTAWHDARLLLTDGLGHRRLLWDPAVVDRVTDLAVAAAAEVRRSSR